MHLLGNARYRAGVRHGVAAAIEHEGAMRSIRIGTLIDVGANIGQFSLLTRTLHPRAIIHGFEPLRLMADRYEQLFAGDSLTTLHRTAAGEMAAETEINVSGRPDSSSLLPISARQEDIFPGTAQASVEKIRVVRIDDVLADAGLPGPVVIKLDVQGYELAALKGMPRILETASHVYVEVSFLELYSGQPLAHEIIAWLAERDFILAGAYNPTFTDDGAAVQADLLFANAAA